MKRNVLCIVGLGILVAGGLLIYGGVKKANSSDPCEHWVSGYVYCDRLGSEVCAGATVVFQDKYEHGNRYSDETNGQGHYELGQVVCDDYEVTVFCGGDYEFCNYITVGNSDCEKNCSNPYISIDENDCLVDIYTNPATCPGSK